VFIDPINLLRLLLQTWREGTWPNTAIYLIVIIGLEELCTGISQLSLRVFQLSVGILQPLDDSGQLLDSLSDKLVQGARFRV